MSAQSGITASPQLLAKFHQFLEQDAKCFVIKIDDTLTQITPFEIISGIASHLTHEDFETLQSLLQHSGIENEPAYIILQNDNSAADKSYTFVSYVPDYATVRLKMIYASTKSTLLKELSASIKLTSSIFITDFDELSLANWKTIVKHERSETPLSEQEQSLQKIKNDELSYLISNKPQKLADVSSGSSSGVLSFQLTPEAQQEIAGTSAVGSLINLGITSNETVKVTSVATVAGHSDLLSEINFPEQPQYSLYHYAQDRYAFIYSCPSGSKVKLRMLYASNKLGLINTLKGPTFGLNVDKEVEVGDISELEVSEFELSEQKSDANSNRLKFNKPKGPRRK
ncbi:hypothetical protein BABINDRAFT_169207 [Babjeviella inositovora NRRL Y-12698]|uniref:ADF-H domain-containing protein n=1 Tax=Babjeviella inositovora NRRL Y-12698 TaxID=984486 RepID=A0A1E3QHZ2_9ASCO|nr:uncharacterized protein BABINDRAFT_169207 [Babjeviella inositovora NRRL Y-12698]ODQ77333.1 hypothetical protein BABINDRAFT_169207 [Babjeviella inositovora NRRL Y-12698]